MSTVVMAVPAFVVWVPPTGNHGVLMVALGVIALVLVKKHKGLYKGSWLGVLGVIFGGIFFAVGGFFIIDYLLRA